MKAIATLIARLSTLVAGIALAGILALVSAQIGMRLFVGNPLSWPEELSRILFIYLVFIGAAEISVRHAHIRVDLEESFGLSHRIDRLLDLGRMVLCIIVLAVIGWGAWQIIPIVASMRLPATSLSMALMVWPVLIGSGLMIVATVLNLIAALRGKELPITSPVSAGSEGDNG